MTSLTIMDTVRRAAAEPFAGAIRYLRHIDPLWQAEIGVPRLWDVRLEDASHVCDCRYCLAETKFVQIEAVTALGALDAAEIDAGTGWYAARVRPVGSNGDYIDRCDLPAHPDPGSDDDRRRG